MGPAEPGGRPGGQFCESSWNDSCGPRINNTRLARHLDWLASGEFPAGTLPCGGTPDLRLERGALKPFVIIPGLVVGANMFKAEPDIVAQRVA